MRRSAVAAATDGGAASRRFPSKSIMDFARRTATQLRLAQSRQTDVTGEGPPRGTPQGIHSPYTDRYPKLCRLSIANERCSYRQSGCQHLRLISRSVIFRSRLIRDETPATDSKPRRAAGAGGARGRSVARVRRDELSTWPCAALVHARTRARRRVPPPDSGVGSLGSAGLEDPRR